MASDSDIARAQLLLGDTGRWTDDQVGDAIDAEGGVPAACVLLLESAATAASFDADVKAGSQSVTQSHVANALYRAAQRIRDDYGLAGGAGTLSTVLPTTCRPVLGGTPCADDAVCGLDSCTCGDLAGCCSCS